MMSRIIDFFGAAQVSGTGLRSPGLPCGMMIDAGVGARREVVDDPERPKSLVTLVMSGFPNFLDQLPASEHYATNVVQPNPGF